MSPLSAALTASRYRGRASPSLTRFAEPQENIGRPSFMASTSAIRRACLPLPLGNAGIVSRQLSKYFYYAQNPSMSAIACGC